MRINANNSYKLVKEEVNNTYEVLKDGLSMEEITDILLHDPKKIRSWQGNKFFNGRAFGR